MTRGIGTPADVNFGCQVALGFRRDPLLVWKFYNARRANVGKVKPNPGHLALAAIEASCPDMLITDWNMPDYVAEAIEKIRRQVGAGARDTLVRLWDKAIDALAAKAGEDFAHALEAEFLDGRAGLAREPGIEVLPVE